jgi:hypothetical protein
VEHEAVFGGHTLRLRFDQRSNVATIQGTDVTLSGDNVILVDGVDTGELAVVLGSRRINPALATIPFRPVTVLRGSQELVDYLRCDERLENDQLQVMVSMMCSTDSH